MLNLLMILGQACGATAQSVSGGVTLRPSGEPFLPGANVVFPDEQVRTVDRVGMWVDSDSVRVGMWPAELKPQYSVFYTDRKKVDALLSLEKEPGWSLTSNFHLAYRLASPGQGWYPRRLLPTAQYVDQWVADFRGGRAGGRTLEQVCDPSFFRWLVQRGYAHESEQASLKEWLAEQSSGTQIQIRPGIQVVRTWPHEWASQHNNEGYFAADVGAAINEVLTALDEPDLAALRFVRVVRTAKASTPSKPKAQKRASEPPPQAVCPTCYMIHAGECF